MKTFTLQSDQHINAPLEEVFDFFSRAENLESLTPPWLRFRIASPEAIEMRAGARIDYRLRLHGIPIGWRSEITVWDPPSLFVDEQLRGPYRRWVHTHTFTPAAGGTRVEDHVEYAVPGGILVNRWFVRRDLDRVFSYRRAALERHFGE